MIFSMSFSLETEFILSRTEFQFLEALIYWDIEYDLLSQSHRLITMLFQVIVSDFATQATFDVKPPRPPTQHV
jgi:hypothetical protein